MCLDNDPAPYLPLIMQRVSRYRAKNRDETVENSVNFALDTVIQHKGTYYRGTGIHDTGHHGYLW